MAFLSVDMNCGLTEEHVDSFNKIGIYTVNDFLTKNLSEIRRRTNIKFQTLRKLLDFIRDRYVLKCNDLSFELEKTIMKCKMVPTGLPELTSALEGGFQTQEIVEFFGESASGKTELCYLLAGEILSHYDYHILFASPDHDICHEKIVHYTKIKAGGKEMSEDEVMSALSRIDIARPSCLADLVHLLNTLIHCDKYDMFKCVIIDSLSFLIQDDLLEIKQMDALRGDDLQKFAAIGSHALFNSETAANVELLRKAYKNTYLNELMRLLTNIAHVKNVMIIVTNSDNFMSNLKAWTNAVDHRILLEVIPDCFAGQPTSTPRMTLRRATIVKTIHNISKIGYSIKFIINEDGLFACRKVHQDTNEEDELEFNKSACSSN